MIALGIGAELTAFNYLFGQSLDAGKPINHAVYLYCDHYWHGVDIRLKRFRPQPPQDITLFYLVVGLVVALAAVEMAQIILTGSRGIGGVDFEISDLLNSYVSEISSNSAAKHDGTFISNRHFSLWH